MATYSPLGSPDDFDGGYFIDWFERHPFFPPTMGLGTGYNAGNNVYDFGDQVVTIDVAAQVIELSECAPNRVRGQFRLRDCVLLGDVAAALKPIRVTFSDPVRAVGAFVGAEGTVNQAYRASINTIDPDTGLECSVRLPAVIGQAVGTAPFLGLRRDGRGLIDEVWFKVSSGDTGPAPGRVAISQLYVLPA